MGADALVLLRSTLPPTDDPDVDRLLALLAAAAGTSAVELALPPGDLGERRVYHRGDVGDPAVELRLDVAGHGPALLRLPPTATPAPGLGPLAEFAVERSLLAFRLHQQAVLLRGALDTTTSAVLLFDPAGDIVYANPPADRLLSRQTEDGLVVKRPGAGPIPLFTLLCTLVEGIASNDGDCPSWLGTVALSDGSVLACELLQVRANGDGLCSGVLALIQNVTALPDRCRDALAASCRFSPREEEMVRLLQEGQTSARIAERLRISPHTVRDHLRAIYRKTGTTSRRALLALLQSTTLAPPLPPSRGARGTGPQRVRERSRPGRGDGPGKAGRSELS